MLYLIAITLFALLIMTFRFMFPEAEKYFWLKISFLFVISLIHISVLSFLFPNNPLYFPIGYIGAVIYLKLFTTLNKNLKILALNFGLAFVLLVNFLPSISLQDMMVYRERIWYINQFNNIQYVLNNSRNSPLQESLYSFPLDEEFYLTQEECLVMLRSWVLTNHGIEIKNYEWLSTVASEEHELIDYYRTHGGYYIVEGTLKFKDEATYFALFKKNDETGRYYIDMIVKYNETSEE